MSNKILVSVDDLSTPYDVDGYVIGYQKFTFFANRNFTYEEIKNFPHPEKIYLLLNTMLHENHRFDFIKEVDRLAKLNINFIVQDLGMVEILKKKVPHSHIIYNPYTLVCNLEEYQTYLEYLDVSIGISSQLSISQLEKFKGHSFITIYGYVPIYQSYRQIISLFDEYHQQNSKKELLVKEDTRDDLHHIIENEYGTVIFSSETKNHMANIDKLKDAEYLYINTMFLSKEEISSVIKEIKNS